MRKRIVKIAKIVGFVLVIYVVWRIASRDTTKTLLVKEIHLEDRVVERTVSTSGEVISENDASLAFKTIGKIYSIAVEKGQEVKKGELLAELENYSTAQTVQSYKDARDIVKRDIDLFVESYGDNLSAYGGKDEYAIRLRKYQEELSKAEATYQAALASLWDTYLYAPFDGTVTEVAVEKGEAVLAGTVVVRVSDLSNLVFEIGLDQEDYGYIRKGQPVEIELDTYPDEIFEGVVKELPFYAELSGANDFEIKIEVLANDITPLMGMTGDAHIIVAKPDSPVPSLMFDEVFFDEQDEPYVWVFADPYIEKLPVEIGLEGDIYTEVKTPIDKPILLGLNDNVELEEGYKAKFAKTN